MLLGAAKLLKQREAELQGTVLLVFQPAEEGGAGADVMVKEGAIAGASAMFGMHVVPFIPSGQVGLRSGTIMAGVSRCATAAAAAVYVNLARFEVRSTVGCEQCHQQQSGAVLMHWLLPIAAESRCSKGFNQLPFTCTTLP
jgi:uncharacterized Fe-S center protein